MYSRKLTDSRPSEGVSTCAPVRSVGLASYSPAMKLTDRRKKAFLNEIARHGILAPAGPRSASAPPTVRQQGGRDEPLCTIVEPIYSNTKKYL